jgi:hypothetical protein
LRRKKATLTAVESSLDELHDAQLPAMAQHPHAHADSRRRFACARIHDQQFLFRTLQAVRPMYSL